MPGIGSQCNNPTYRSEYLSRVAEGLGRDSSRIVLEYVRRSDLDTSLQFEKLSEAEIKEVEKAADDYLVEAEQVCREIEARSGRTRPWSGQRSTRASRSSTPGPLASPAASRTPRRGPRRDPGRRVAMSPQAGRRGHRDLCRGGRGRGAGRAGRPQRCAHRLPGR